MVSLPAVSRFGRRLPLRDGYLEPVDRALVRSGEEVLVGVGGCDSVPLLRA